MKLIIAGSRNLEVSNDYIWNLLSSSDIENITEIVSGDCPSGIDKCGIQFAELHSLPIKRFSANWAKYGKSAGPIRNREMAEYADALLLIWDGESKGSKSMLNEMKELEKPTYEVIIKNEGGCL